MNQRGPHDPDQITAPPLLLAYPRGQLLVIDRPLPAHLGGHEPELVGPMPAAEKSPGVDQNAFGAVLRLAHRHELALTKTPRLDSLQHGAALHHDAVHPGPGRRQPASVHPDIGRQLEVLKKPSGRTPSAGSGSHRASGAPAKGGWVKSGNTLDDEEVMWGWKVG